MVVHTCNPGIQEAEAAELCISDRPMLPREILLIKTTAPAGDDTRHDARDKPRLGGLGAHLLSTSCMPATRQQVF
jgi:hypothetical protein